MKNIRKKPRERGQAMAEYQVLFPAGILLAGFMLPLIATAARGMVCDAVQVFNPDACPVEVAEGVVEPEDEVCVVHEETLGGSQCDQDQNCTLIDVGINNGTWTNPLGDPLKSFIIKAGQDYFMFESGETNDGCYYVDFSEDGNSVTWNKIGSGPQCQDVSHTEMWYVALCVLD